MTLLLLGASAIVTYILAQKLSGDSYAAAPAALIYTLSPVTLSVAGADRRLAVCVHLLPIIFILFYRLTAMPIDAELGKRRLVIGITASALASMAYLDSRFATVAALCVWIVILTGFFMHKRRWSGEWTEPFKTWSLCCLFGMLPYIPIWWWKRIKSGSSGAGWPNFPMAGADFVGLWSPSAVYVGLSVLALASAGLFLSRSYKPQIRLWAILTGICLWLGLGAGFHWNGEYVWWVPALYRGARKVGWLGSIPPGYFLTAAQFTLAIMAAYSTRALWTLFPPARLRWVRPLITLLLLGLLAADLTR